MIQKCTIIEGADCNLKKRILTKHHDSFSTYMHNTYTRKDLEGYAPVCCNGNIGGENVLIFKCCLSIFSDFVQFTCTALVLTKGYF